ncbi:MAG: GIY-YIG nuclease family protein [bacterium]|nr:GIY-YIG nuclease family protein [bacterium]
MYYTYVLQSESTKHFYVGYTNDLKRRFLEHQENKSLSTKNRGPWRLVYYEASTSKTDALIRENYLKTAWGKRYIKNRISHST